MELGMELEKLQQIVNRLSSHLDIPPPKVILRKASPPSAFSINGWWGAGEIVVNSGLTFSPLKEIEAILAHEVIHIQANIKNRIVLFAQIIGVPVFIGVLALSRGTPLLAWLGVLSILLMVVFVRRSEREADEGAANITSPIALIRALERLEPYEGILARITHRTIKERIAHIHISSSRDSSTEGFIYS